MTAPKPVDWVDEVTQSQFRNALRILLNIDRWDVKWMGDRKFSEFIANPHRFFITCDDPTSDALWAIICERNGAAAMRAEACKPGAA